MPIEMQGFQMNHKKHNYRIHTKEDLHRKLGIFVLLMVSDWKNVLIVTWLSYAEEELTNSLALAPVGWQNVSRQAVRLYLHPYTDKGQTNSLN